MTKAPDDGLEACPGQSQLTTQPGYVLAEVILIDDFPNGDGIGWTRNRLEFSG